MTQDYTSYDRDSTPESAPPPEPVPPPTPVRCGLALASLILSILGIVACCVGPILGIPGAICGHVALSRIKRDNLAGSGMAIAGIVLGYLSLPAVIVSVIMAGITMPSLSGAREQARLAQSLNRTRCIATAAITYADMHDGMLPESFENLETVGISPQDLKSPFAPDDVPIGYELLLRGKIESYGDPANTPLVRDLYTAGDGRRATAFLDGSARLITESEALP